VLDTIASLDVSGVNQAYRSAMNSISAAEAAARQHSHFGPDSPVRELMAQHGTQAMAMAAMKSISANDSVARHLAHINAGAQVRDHLAQDQQAKAMVALKSAASATDSIVKQFTHFDPDAQVRELMAQHSSQTMARAAMDTMTSGQRLFEAAGPSYLNDSVLKSQALASMATSVADQLPWLQGITGNTAISEALKLSRAWTDPMASARNAALQGLGAINGDALKQLLGAVSQRDFLANLAVYAGDAEYDESAQSETVFSAARTISLTAENSLTLQDVVNQLVTAIRGTKDTTEQRILATIIRLFQILLLLAATSVVDFQVKEWLQNREKVGTTVSQVRHEAAASIGDLRLLGEYRFITAKTTQVRAGPGTLAPVLGGLTFGQVVYVIEKRKDFSLVRWTSPDESVQLRGWVFSRYLTGFQ